MVYNCEQFRRSMIMTLLHPTLNDLDVPASPLQLSKDYEPCREAPSAPGADQAEGFAG